MGTLHCAHNDYTQKRQATYWKTIKTACQIHASVSWNPLLHVWETQHFYRLYDAVVHGFNLLVL
jgi:hypothetical protein